MSNVTSLIFCGFEDNIDAINQWLSEQGYGEFGSHIAGSECSGGHKGFETDVVCAGFNYFDMNTFLDFLWSLEWDTPENIQILTKGEDEDKFSVMGLSPPLIIYRIRR